MKTFFLINAAMFLLLAVTQTVAAEVKNPIVVGGRARFTVITPECVRMEFSTDGKFIDAPSMFAANRSARSKDFKLRTVKGTTIIETKSLKIEYKADGKPFNKSNLKAEIKKAGGSVTWQPGMTNSGNLGGTIRTVDGVSGPVDLGEGVLSRNGWYLLDDSRKQLFTADWVKSRPKSAGEDWYLFGYGLDYQGALESLTAIGGEVPLPRKYSLGAWYSRYWPYTSKEYRQIVKEFESHGFPLDVMVMDMDWHKDGWTGWSWNRKLLPDAEDLLKWFHEQNLRVTMNVHPADGIGPHEDMYEAFMKEMGKDPATKETIPYNAGNKKYLDTLFKYTHNPHEAEGVDFWWLDWQQYPFTLSIPDLTNLAWLNNYYFKHTGRDGLRGQSFSRWAGWGDHRNPIHFSGDSHTGWSMLAFEVPFTSVAGNIGCFFWSHDIGGHMGNRNVESYTRWVQFGATSAALRSHSTRSPELDRRPWKYFEWAENSMRISFHLRSELFPYIYTSAWRSHKDSIPLNRAMYMEYPEKDEAYKNPQQYFYGDSLLVAPVVSPGTGPKKVGRQVVWFPNGTWYNWFTGEKFKGESEAVVTADINEFPIYAKAGVPIPMQPYTHRMASDPLKQLVVRAYPGADGKTGRFTLYEDDGVTTEYQTGASAKTELSYVRKGDSVTVSIGAVKGKYKGQLKKRSYIIELPCAKKATGARAGGKAVKVVYDEKEFINRIYIPESPIGKAVKVTAKVKQVDDKEMKVKAAARRIEGATGAAASGKTVSGLIASIADKQLTADALEAALASAGVAMFKKNEGVYLYKGVEKFYFYAPAGALDGDKFKAVIEDKFGDDAKEIYSGAGKAGAGKQFIVPKLPPLKSPPAFGISGERTLKIDFSIAGKPFSLSRVLESRNSNLTKWNLLGPFNYDPSANITGQKYEPEDDAAKLKTSYKDSSGKKIVWRRASADENDNIDIAKNLIRFEDNRLVYAVTNLVSEKDQNIILKIQFNYGLQVWLNGENVFSGNGSGDVETVTEINRKLNSGDNILIVKAGSRQQSDWRFGASVVSQYPVKQYYWK